MPSPLATILFTWAAVYAYVGVFYCILHVRRPTFREHLVFALTCLSFSVWAAGAAIGEGARGLETAVFAARLRYVGGFAVVALFAEFAIQLEGRRSPTARRAVTLVRGVSGLSVLAAIGGLLFDGERVPEVRFMLIDSPRVQPAFTPFGVALSLGFIALASWAVRVTARGIRRQRELRVFAWTGGVAVVAGLHDTLTLALGFQSIDLLAHAGLFPVLAISGLLLKRFVRAADELSRRTEEVRRSYLELHVTQEELVRKEQLAAVGELSAVIAHEVRNPLAIIKNAVSSLRRPVLRPTDRAVLLGILDEEVDRLSRLVRDLLAYARPVEPQGRPVELLALVDRVLETTLAAQGVPSSIRVDLDLERCPVAYGDPDLIRQALANVIDNAVAAMPHGGVLSIRSEPARVDGGRAAAISVVDTGEGMDTLVLSKARNPFFTTRAAGTGLGLAIVERVVKNHGGSLLVESVPGGGTTVRLVLPNERRSSVPPEASP